MDTLPEETAILYLWQNEHTIVVGRNQDPWQECRVEDFLASGGHIARRQSGGGAVYHDLGNLNFTLIVPKVEFDIPRQLAVLQLVMGALGLRAEQSGRNDLQIAGRKFSGSAFYKAGASAYHHGTLLIGADMGVMSRYLTVDPQKLAQRGVRSVPARVLNLRELLPELPVERVEEAVFAAFAQVYGSSPAVLDERMLDRPTLDKLTVQFSDPSWIYPAKGDYGFSVSERSPWGGVTVQLRVEGGVITDARLFTDAMEAGLFTLIEQSLVGCPYLISAISSRLRQKFELLRGPALLQMAGDVVTLICGRIRALDRAAGQPQTEQKGEEPSHV